ncbi:MAG TPA: metallophosphoesterase [Dermatophilaceae bacterium]|nr:metallophosphoesterase [Dermatophilaceae bacterium]
MQWAPPRLLWLDRLRLRHLGLVTRWLAIVGACYLGGVAATNLSPTTVETAHYRAVIRLDPLPLHTPVLHSPTIVGDVDVEFTSPALAPGLDMAVSVREEITNLFTRKDVSVRSLQPSDDEISQAARDAGVGLGVRFGLGALVTAIGLSLSVQYVRRRPPLRGHVIMVGSAMLVAAVGTAASMVTTYQPSRFTEYRTTGVLGTVQRNAGMLAGVEARAEQVAPYLRNLLAVSQALQEKFVPSDLSRPVAARFLLVSDIHGANSYSLMRTIIEEEQVDAVIDTGDLINFGRVAEAEAAGMFRGIESLGVPYIFVDGNHDASSPTDTELLRRMDAVPNVVLLQDASGQHLRYTLNGLRITGFNDPRYFGDDATDLQGKEAPAADAYNLAMEGQPESDIVLTHEPYAAELVDAGRLLVNGHIHTAERVDNRIQVGTFTGGGVVSHYTEGENAELTGQPYAFDIATFGSTCSLTQLTRYSYRNVLEGRPAYDTVQVVNGERIVAPLEGTEQSAASPGEGPADGSQAVRRCGAGEPTTTTPLPAEGVAPGSTSTPTPTTVTP